MIRAYNPNKDFETLYSWWVTSEQVPPTREMMPDSTYIAYDEDGNDLVAVSMILTNTKEYCYLDNFIGNPRAGGAPRRNATKKLLFYVSELAVNLGYSKIFCISVNPKTTAYYKHLGFTQTCKNVDTFVKEVGSCHQ